jgi:hypothetical protein
MTAKYFRKRAINLIAEAFQSIANHCYEESAREVCVFCKMSYPFEDAARTTHRIYGTVEWCEGKDARALVSAAKGPEKRKHARC